MSARIAALRAKTVDYLLAMGISDIDEKLIRRVLIHAGACIGHTCHFQTHNGQKFWECSTVSCGAIAHEVICCPPCREQQCVVLALPETKQDSNPVISDAVRNALTPAQLAMLMSLRGLKR